MTIWIILLLIIYVIILNATRKSEDKHRYLAQKPEENTPANNRKLEREKQREQKKKYANALKEQAMQQLIANGFSPISCFVSFTNYTVWGYAKKRGEKYKYNIPIDELGSVNFVEPEEEDELSWIDEIEEMEDLLD